MTGILTRVSPAIRQDNDIMDMLCQCAACGGRFKVDARHAGKKAKCPKCGQLTPLPGGDSTGDAASSPSTTAAPDVARRPRFLDSHLTQASATAPDLSHVQQPAAPAAVSRGDADVAAFLAAIPAATAIPAAPPPQAPEDRLPSKSAPPAAANPAASAAAATPSFVPTPPSAARRGGGSTRITSLVLVVGGGLAALALVIVGIAGMIAWSLKRPVVVFDWPAPDRIGATLRIDKKTISVPKQGPFQTELVSGEHRLFIARSGYEPIEYGFTLKNGDEWKYRPEFVPRRPSVPPNSANTPNLSNPSPAGFVPTSPGAGVDAARNPQGFAGWEQLLEVAQRKAGEQKKDLLIVFSGSDGSQPSIKMTNDVFSHAQFLEFARARFVLLVIDSPRTPLGVQQLANRTQNQALVQRFGVETTPTVVLADSGGAPYAAHGYLSMDVGAYLNHLNLLTTNHAMRDQLVLRFQLAAAPAQKLAAAEETLKFLRQQRIPRSETRQRRPTEQVLDMQNELGLARFYPTLLRGLLQSVGQIDPKNERGKLERFFEADWRARASAPLDDRQREAIVRELDDWCAARKFVDPDRAVTLHLLAAVYWENLRKPDLATRQLELAVQFKPEQKMLSDAVQGVARFLKTKDLASVGAGFVVDPLGYLLTNYHVVAGEGRLVVRRPDNQQEVEARLVAHDAARDIALLRVDPAAFAEWKSTLLCEGPIGRGARVAMFGFPLGDAVGQGLKFASGVVSGLPDASNNRMLLIDGRVNRGNSGGPLCNTHGHVVGMVTSKSAAGAGVDSYGMALPADDLIRFLAQHLPDAPQAISAETGEPLEWDAVDRIVSPSVLMVLRRK